MNPSETAFLFLRRLETKIHFVPNYNSDDTENSFLIILLQTICPFAI
jgi:hypothetical protein